MSDPYRWTFNGRGSDLCGGYSMIAEPSCYSVSTVWTVIWRQELPCNRTSFHRGWPWRSLLIFGFSLCFNISLLYSTFIVALPSWRWARIDPCWSQTTLNIICATVGWDFHSFSTKKLGSFHSILWRLFYGSYVLSQDSRSMISEAQMRCQSE